MRDDTNRLNGKNAVLAFGVLVMVAAALAALSAPLLPKHAMLGAVLAGSVVSLTNDERTDEGLPLLVRNQQLERAAQLKAEDMAKEGYYAHVSPDGETPMHWADMAGYKYRLIGENLVVERNNATDVVSAFMGSPGHRANILRSDYTEMGVGVANGKYKGKDTTFVVQLFAAPTVAAAKPTPVQTVTKASEEAAKPAPAKVVAPVRTIARVPLATTTATKATTTPSDPLAAVAQEILAPIVSSLQGTSSVATTTLLATSTPSISSVMISQSDVIEVDMPYVYVEEEPPSWGDSFRIFADRMWMRIESILGR